MEITESDLNRLVDFIFKNLQSNRWLYWPPGPMMGQVFDRDACKRELQRFLESL
jgi:hypothetical protein